MMDLIPDQAHKPDLATGTGDETITQLPIPLAILSTDHGVHRIEEVSSGFAALFSSTQNKILTDYADNPLHAIAESERDNALGILEYALMYPGQTCVGTFHMTSPFHWPSGDRFVRCSIQSTLLAEGRWRSYATLSPVPVGQGITDGERPRDLTERTLEEQILARLSTLGYEIVGMIFVQTGEVRYFRMRKMLLGLEFEDVEIYRDAIEEDLDRVIAVEDREDVKRAFALEHVIEELEHSELYSYPFSMTTRDGRHLRKLLQFTYMDESKETIFICRSDISRQYQEELAHMERLKKAKTSAEEARASAEAARASAEAANEAKSMFLASMSHDLRTPLNGIIGFTDLAISTEDPAKKQDYLTKVKSSSTLLLDLVNDTLDLSRIESGKLTLEPSTVSLREPIQTVLTSLHPSAEIKGVDLIANLWNGPDRAVWLDQLNFQKILLNLISNAIKYTPSGGTVRVDVELLDDDGKKGDAGTAGADDAGRVGKKFECHISVVDNGIGIDAAFIPHVFDAFAQERQPGTAGVMGTGLGLAIVKRLVGLMGGTVAVKSVLGEGSTFSVNLPLEQVNTPAATPEDEAVDSHVLRGTRMLVCEDNFLNSEIVCAILEEEGVQTTCANDGAEGMSRFNESHPGDFSAILMDVRMPVMDGIEATHRIRALERPDAKTIPIIALTGDILDEDVHNCEQAGMSAVVGKPIDRARLISTLVGLVSDGENTIR